MAVGGSLPLFPGSGHEDTIATSGRCEINGIQTKVNWCRARGRREAAVLMFKTDGKGEAKVKMVAGQREKTIVRY